MKKIRKVFIACSTLACMATFLTGCTNKPTRVETLETKINDVLKVESKDDENIKKFKLMGVDVSKTAFDFDVKFNGVCNFEGSKDFAFSSANYTVSSELFKKLGKRSSTDALYDVFDYVVDNYEMKGYSVTKVNDLASINSAFVKNSPSPFKGYNLYDALLYSISDKTFDDENHSISFEAKTIMNLRKANCQIGWGLGIGFNGGFGLGVGPFVEVKEGDFTATDVYTLNLTEQEYESMKQDEKLIYDFCADAINSKDSSKISVDREVVTDVAYDHASVFKSFDMNKAKDEFNIG